MKREPTSARDLLVDAAVPLLALILLVLLPLWTSAPERPGAPGLPLLVALGLLAALGSLHPPHGPGTLALGAAALPPALVYFGPTAAAWMAATALLLRWLALFGVSRLPAFERRRPAIRSALESAGAVVLGVAVAAWVLAVLGGRGPELLAGRELYLRGAAATGAYLVTVGALRILSAAARGQGPLESWRQALAPLFVDAGGWALGLLAAAAVPRLGWAAALLLLAGVSLLALEAARNSALRHTAMARARELREVTLAGHRIIFRTPDLPGIAEQIQIECRRVLPFAWFQFELVWKSERGRSWWAGPDGRVREGAPAPPERPPTRPGIRRRTGWKVIERELATRDEHLVLLRFWCDPADLEPTALELLDSLLPQMASSVHRVLLDRDARRDPLTDLPDRRALESRLERAFADSMEDGTPMAIIMCDLDRFKRINDRLGHTAGDEALVEVARLLEDHRRETDLCCRYGGEEFAVILERSDGETALRVAERLRRAVEQLAFVTGGKRVPLRVSAGIAAFPELPVRQAVHLLKLADDALYEAKRKGRNRCLLHAGNGRFMDAEGGYSDDGEPQRRLEPPTLFA